jgi:hypothetical protein
MKVEVPDPNDDWVATGAVLTAENDATFRLSLGPTWPDEYGSFVSAPWTTLPASPTANLIGAYLPPDPTYVFTTGGINLGWYDSANSLNGDRDAPGNRREQRSGRGYVGRIRQRVLLAERTARTR